MPGAFDIGTVQPLNGGQFQTVDPNITNPGQSKVAEDFANAMGAFEPAVRKIAITKQADISEEQTRQTLAYLQDEQAKGEKTAGDLVRSGQLPLGANPWAQKAARQMFMRGLARKIGEGISADYETSPVKNADANTVEQWANTEFQKRVAKLGFANPHDMDYLEGFAPTKDAVVGQLVGYHIKTAAERTVRDLKEGISQDAAWNAQDGVLLGDTEGAAKIIGQSTLKQAIMTGMAPRDAYENVLDGLLSKAEATGDTSYLDIAEKVPTTNERNEEVPLGQRTWAMDKIERARAALTSRNAHEASRTAEAKKMQLKDNKDTMEGEMISALQQATAAQVPDVIKGIQQKARGMVQSGDLEGKALADLDQAADTFLTSQKTRGELGVGSVFNNARAMDIINEIHQGNLVDFGQITAAFQGNPDLTPYYKDALQALAGTRDRVKGDGDFLLKSVLDGYTRKIDLTNPDNALLLAQITNRFYSTMNLWRQQNPNAPVAASEAKAPSVMGAATDLLNAMDKDYFGYKTNTPDGGSVDKKPFQVGSLESLYDTHVRIQSGIADEAQKAQAQVDLTDREIKQGQLATKTYSLLPASGPPTFMKAITKAEMARTTAIGNRLVELAQVTGDAKAQAQLTVANKMMSDYYNLQLNPRVTSAMEALGYAKDPYPNGAVRVPTGMREEDFQAIKKAGLIQEYKHPGGWSIEWVTDPMKAAQVISDRALESINSTSAPLRQRAKEMAAKVAK